MADPKAEMAEDLRADLEKQISDLKREMSRMSKSLAARASDALEDAGDAASDALEESRGRARRIGRHVNHQAQAVAHAVRENPGTAATVLSTAALFGFVAGLALGGVLGGNDRGYSRWR